MSAINALFMLNSSGNFEVNKVEAKTTPEYEVLFKRDTHSPGDSDGRKKLIACAEIYYIFLLEDIRSAYYNLPLEERKIKAKEIAKLPEKWKEDAAIKDARNRYKKDFELTASGKAYVTAEKAYYTIATDVQDMQEELVELKALLNTKLKKLKDKGLGETDLVSVAKETNAIIKEILINQKEVMKNITDFAKLGKQVKELAATFIEEGGSVNIPVGGGTLGNRET